METENAESEEGSMRLTKKQRVEKGLKQCLMDYHIDEYNEQCMDCPYFDPDIECMKCKQYLLEEALEVLKTSVNVVRCENCGWWEAPSKAEQQDGSTIGRCRHAYGVCCNEQTDATWFCANGVKV